MTEFDSLTLALEAWFDRPLGDLPVALRLRASNELKPHRWETLEPEQRRTVALQLDYHRDPATAREREYWWDFHHRMSEIEAELQRNGSNDGKNLDELLGSGGRLKELRIQIERMKARERAAKDRYYPQHRGPVQDQVPGRYLAYPKALRHLVQQLGASPEELAAWVFLGGQHGGLDAYLNANELDPPPQFNFGSLPIFDTPTDRNADYVSPLMGCWFSSDDVADFKPADRFITGKALIARWSLVPNLKVEAFVRAKIRESRLLDLHPIYGGTQASGVITNAAHLPPMTEGLFRLVEVEAIEFEDFADDDSRNDRVSSAMPAQAKPAGDGVTAKSLTDASFASPTRLDVAVGLPSDPTEDESIAMQQRPKSLGGTSLVGNHSTVDSTTAAELKVGSPEWRQQNARAAANALHGRPGGSRDIRRRICDIWATGKYSSRDTCAEEECAALGISFTTARRALSNVPDPTSG